MSEELDMSGIQIPQEQEEAQESTLSPEELKKVQEDIELEKKYGDQPLKAAVAGAARGASFGISDQTLVKLGIVDQQTLRELEARNKEASIAGEVAGIVAPAVLSGGTTAVAKGAQVAGAGIKAAEVTGKAIEALSEKALKTILKHSGDKAVAASIIQKNLPKIAGSAVEGGFYGAGQLISEDALGTKDFNAENLVASVGTGAILGGIAGGAFNAFESLVPVIKKGGEVVLKEGKEFINPVDNTLKVWGTTPNQSLKLKKLDPALVEDLPNYTFNKLETGIFTSDRKLYENAENLMESASTKIDEVLQKSEKIALSNPQVMVKTDDIYAKALSIIDTYLAPKKLKTLDMGKINTLRRDLFNTIGKEKDEFFTPVKLNEFRKEIDSKINYKVLDTDQTEFNKVAKQIRVVIRNEIDQMVDKAANISVNEADRTLLSELKEANKDFHYMSTMLPYIEKKVETKSALGFMETMRGAALIGAFKTAGVAAAMGARLAESDLARKFLVLRTMEKSNSSLDKNITRSVNSFFKSSKDSSIPISTNVMLETAFGREDLNGKKPKDKKEALENIKNNFNSLKQDPEKFLNTLKDQTALLMKHAPGTQVEVASVVQRAMQFLNSKLPRDPKEASIFPSKWEPSSLELAKFQRYLEAVEDPRSVLRDFERGSLSPEAVDALRSVYPNLYGRLQKTAMDKISEDPEAVSYPKRLQLGLLLDMPTDNSLINKSILSLQSSFISKALPQPPKAEKMKKLGSSLATPIEKVLNRE